jgi:hypothetical protein
VFSENEMMFNAEGEVTGATIEALVRKLTLHEKSPGERKKKRLKQIRIVYLTCCMVRSYLYKSLLLQLSRVHKSGRIYRFAKETIYVIDTF